MNILGWHMIFATPEVRGSLLTRRFRLHTPHIGRILCRAIGIRGCRNLSARLMTLARIHGRVLHIGRLNVVLVMSGVLGRRLCETAFCS